MSITAPLLSRYYVANLEFLIDETMRKFKGRIYCRQYIPNKPICRDIKLWSLCKSKTGYLMKYGVYTGRVDGAQPYIELTHGVVMDL